MRESECPWRHLANARIPIQIDIGFGDIVTPAPLEATYPTLLAMPAPRLRIYPKETVVAEKLEAMVKLGIANSRMKDFYDVRALSWHFTFDGQTLAQAIAATFRRRRTEIPVGTPLALTPEFYDSPAKQTQWNAFLRKSSLEAERSLAEVASALSDFLLPVLAAVPSNDAFRFSWSPGGPWRLSS